MGAIVKLRYFSFVWLLDSRCVFWELVVETYHSLLKRLTFFPIIKVSEMTRHVAVKIFI